MILLTRININHVPVKLMANIYTGSSGYTYNGWYAKNFANYTLPTGQKISPFYPEGVTVSKALKYYSEHYRIVEINNTFYKLPTPNVIKQWYNQTPADFKFILKFSRYATHAKKLLEFPRLFEEFWDNNAEHLKEKCLGILIQLGPTFVYSNKKSEKDGMTMFERLELASKYLKTRNLPIQYFVEFRHSSWFTTSVYDKVASLGFYPVCVNLNSYEFPTMNNGFSPDLSYYANNGGDKSPAYIYLRCHGTWLKSYHGGYKQEDLMKMVSLFSITKTLIIIFDNTDSFEGEEECFIQGKVMFNNKIFSKSQGPFIHLLPHCLLNAAQVQELANGKYTESLWLDS